MAISLRLSEEEDKLFKSFAALNDISVSELIRQTVLERIEDEFDLKAYKNAMVEFQKDPTTFTHDEVVQMLEQLD